MTLADAATINANPEYFIGIATQDFANNQFGYVTVLGKVRGLNTSAYTAGDLLYYNSTSATDGLLTATMPSAPNAKILVAAVLRVHANEGILLVRPHTMPKISDIQDVSISSLANNNFFVYDSATSVWKNKTIAAALGYTPANDSNVVKLTGDQTVAGAKTFTSVINASTLSINGGTLVGNNIVSMRSNPTGGQFRIEKSDGSLSAYPFYIGVDGTALAYYYNASGALKVLLHTNDTSYFGNSLSVGYSTYASTSYMLDVNGTGRFISSVNVQNFLTVSSASTLVAPSSGKSIEMVYRTDGANDYAFIQTYDRTNSVFKQLRITGSTLILNEGGGNVGFGLTNPQSQIHLNGTITFSESGYDTVRLHTITHSHSDGSNVNNWLSFNVSNGSGVTNTALRLNGAGQLRLNSYTASSSFSGTAAGYLAFDSSGNVITVAGVAATDNTKLPLAGGTMTGQLIIGTTGIANSPSVRINTSSSASFVHTQENFAANLTAGQRAMIFFGKVGSTKNAGGIGYYWAGDASNSNFITLGHWGNDDLLRVYGDGVVQTTGYLRTAGVTSNTVLFNAGASSVDFGNAFGQGTTNRSVYFRGNTGVSAWWGGIDANGANIPFAAIDATAGEFSFWRNTAGTGGGTWTNIMTMNASGLTMVVGNFIGNLSGNATTATTASSVAWSGVSAGTRTNYTLAFQPPTGDYAGFEFTGTNGAGAGYFLIRGTSDSDVYTAEGITLVADQGWLTLAQRTAVGKGIRFMTGSTTSVNRMQIDNSGLVTAFVNLQVGSQQGFDNPGGWNKNILIDATNHGRFRIKASNYTYGNIEVYLWADSSVSPSHGIYGSNSVFSFGGNIASLTVGGQTVLNAGNYSSYALPLNGNWSGNTGMNDQKLYLRTNGDNNHYLWNADDDWEELVAYSGTGFRIKASNGTTLATFATGGNSMNISGNSSTTSQRSFDYLYASSYLESGGAVYGTIFYDNNDRTYYCDPTGNSRLVSLNIGFTSGTTYNTGASGKIYFNSHGESDINGYSIGTTVVSMNGYSYTKLDLSWHTGIRIGAYSLYGGTRFYNNSPAYYDGGEVMSIASGDNHIRINYDLYVGYGRGSSNIFMYDSDETSRRIHCNSNRIGFLNSSDGWGAWCNNDGSFQSARKVQGEYLYSDGWIYSSGGNTGWLQDNQNQGIRAAGYNSYFGTIATYGTNSNGYGGYTIMNNYRVILMQNSSGDFGFYNNDDWKWNLFYNRSNNCWGIGTDNTYSGDGFRCIKYGSAEYGWTTWSDRRAKENISSITGALDTVLAMRGVYFNYIKDETKNKRVGFIAQELEQVLPEAVRYAEDIDEYSVEYAQIVSVLAEAIKEQDAKMKLQEDKIALLQAQLQTLLN
jgi:hypothetical protein